MTLSLSLRDVLHAAETLLIAAAGGVGLSLLGMPAGMVSGSVLAVAVAALCGRPVWVPVPISRVCFVLIGILLGAVVTPATLHGIATWPASVMLLAVATVSMIVATTSYLRFVHGWDRLSAFLGASPGSMAQVIALAAEFKGDIRGIAIVQVMRVLLVTIGLPGGLALFGFVATSMMVPPPPAGGNSAAEVLVLVVSATALAVLLTWLRFPGALLFGAMAASGFLHATGLVHSVLPWWLGSTAVIVLGALAGARFANTSPRIVFDYLGAAFGSFAVAVAIASFFVFLVVTFLPFRTADVVIAFAPGSQDQMMLLALALHLDPVYVGAHHLARWLVVTTSIVTFARKVAKSPVKGPAPSIERKHWRRRGQGNQL